MKEIWIGFAMSLILYFVCDIKINDWQWWIMVIFMWFVYILGDLNE